MHRVPWLRLAFKRESSENLWLSRLGCKLKRFTAAPFESFCWCLIKIRFSPGCLILYLVFKVFFCHVFNGYHSSTILCSHPAPVVIMAGSRPKWHASGRAGSSVSWSLPTGDAGRSATYDSWWYHGNRGKISARPRVTFINSVNLREKAAWRFIAGPATAVCKPSMDRCVGKKSGGVVSS